MNNIDIHYSSDWDTLENDNKPKKKPIPPKPPISKEHEINNSGKFKPTSKGKYLYIIPIINILLTIVVAGIIIYTRVGILWFILYSFFAIPFTIANIFTLFIKMFIDRKQIKNKVVTKVSNNYVMSNMFMDKGGLRQQAMLIEKDGKHFMYNGGVYILEKDCIWWDDNKRPNIFHLENLPNPIKFGFGKEIKEYVKAITSGEITLLNSIDSLEIDVTYSSQNLAMFKKDKMMNEFHRNPESDKIVMALIGALCLIVIAFVIIFVLVK